jgi:hypothetical protein
MHVVAVGQVIPVRDTPVGGWSDGCHVAPPSFVITSTLVAVAMLPAVGSLEGVSVPTA